jgi:uncharacterized MAPEG superfamily protein
MTTDLTMLAWSIVLGIVHVFATGAVATLQHGWAYNMGPRDDQRPITGKGGRLIRAYANFMQTFPFFVAAVLMAHVVGRHSWLTVTGAEVYFWARAAYVPLYVLGVPAVRSLAFVVATAGIVMILVALT